MKICVECPYDIKHSQMLVIYIIGQFDLKNIKLHWNYIFFKLLEINMINYNYMVWYL